MHSWAIRLKHMQLTTALSVISAPLWQKVPRSAAFSSTENKIIRPGNPAHPKLRIILTLPSVSLLVCITAPLFPGRWMRACQQRVEENTLGPLRVPRQWVCSPAVDKAPQFGNRTRWRRRLLACYLDVRRSNALRGEREWRAYRPLLWTLRYVEKSDNTDTNDTAIMIIIIGLECRIMKNSTVMIVYPAIQSFPWYRPVRASWAVSWMAFRETSSSTSLSSALAQKVNFARFCGQNQYFRSVKKSKQTRLQSRLRIRDQGDDGDDVVSWVVTRVWRFSSPLRGQKLGKRGGSGRPWTLWRRPWASLNLSPSGWRRTSKRLRRRQF